MSRLKKRYKEQVKTNLQEKFAYTNVMMIPKVEKIIISMGIAEATKDRNIIQDHAKELTMLSGQAPVITYSKKAIAGFKLRQGQALGLKVTLRGDRMYDFMDRFFNVVSPRIRDFRGFTPKGDGNGNYSLGIEDQNVFPEINLDEVKRAQGMNITFVTTAKTDEECIELLRLLGLPFKNLTVVVAA